MCKVTHLATILNMLVLVALLFVAASPLRSRGRDRSCPCCIGANNLCW